MNPETLRLTLDAARQGERPRTVVVACKGCGIHLTPDTLSRISFGVMPVPPCAGCGRAPGVAWEILWSDTGRPIG